MTETYDLVVRGGTCLTPAGRLVADLGIKNGRIVDIGDLRQADAAETLEARGLHVLPGVIDTQVHFREPGLEHKEDIATGSRAAILGGVTAFFEMPNTTPNTTTAEDLADKLARAAGRALCDHAFFIGATAENADELAFLESLSGCAGIKVFMGSSTGTLLVDDDDTLRDVLSSGQRRVAVHAEDEARLLERKHLVASGADVSQHPVWRDAETAWIATRRLLRLADETRRRVHVLHVTTTAEMELLAQHKDLASVEVTPQHLTLAAPACYEALGSLAQMNPPIRGENQRAGLWKALTAGIIDVIGSDHAPHTLEEKARAYPSSPSGMTGVQTLLPIMLDHVAAGRLSLERLVDLVSAGPARVYGISRKGRLATGYDGDLTLVDLQHKRVISNDWIASRAGWTPFDGVAVTGWPRATVVRGRVVMRDDEVIGKPCGQPVRFESTL